jgi:autotransporter-associated beta strand protein
MLVGYQRTSGHGVAAVIAAAVLAAGVPLSAATYTWDGGGTSANWDAPLNWNAAPTFDSTTDIVFYADAARLSTFLGSTKVIRSLTFNSAADSAVTIRTTTSADNTTAANLNMNGGGNGASIAVDAGSAGAHSIGVEATAGGVNLQDNLTIDHNGSAAVTFNRRIAQSGGTYSVTKNGTGQVVFSGTSNAGLSDYAGGFIMNAGSVQNNNVTGYGTGTLFFNGGTIRQNNITIPNDVIVGNTGNPKVLQHGNNSVATYSGNFTLNETTLGNFEINVTGTAGLVISGVIGGPGGILKTGSTVLELDSANTFTGVSKPDAGRIRLDNRLALQFSAIDTSGAGDISANSGSANYVIGGLISGRDLASAFFNDTNVAILTLNPQSGSVSYDNVISNLSAAMALVKTGLGTQVLGGNNTYSGTTSVAAGSLFVNGNQSTATGAMTVAAGATLGGTGTIGASLSTVGGLLAPGSAGTDPGLLTLNALTLTPTAETRIDINGYLRGGSFDAVNVVNSLTYSGTLAFDMPTLLSGTFNIFDFTSSSGALAAVTGLFGAQAVTFTNSAGVWTAPLTSGSATFTQATGELIVVPEPPAIALILVGLGLVGLRRLRGSTTAR